MPQTSVTHLISYTPVIWTGIRLGHFKISDNLRHLPPPRDRPRRRQRKIAVFVRCKGSFSNDLCAHVADFRRELAGFNVEILDFEILDFEIFG